MMPVSILLLNNIFQPIKLLHKTKKFLSSEFWKVTKLPENSQRTELAPKIHGRVRNSQKTEFEHSRTRGNYFLLEFEGLNFRKVSYIRPKNFPKDWARFLLRSIGSLLVRRKAKKNRKVIWPFGFGEYYFSIDLRIFTSLLLR